MNRSLIHACRTLTCYFLVLGLSSFQVSSLGQDRGRDDESRGDRDRRENRGDRGGESGRGDRGEDRGRSWGGGGERGGMGGDRGGMGRGGWGGGGMGGPGGWGGSMGGRGPGGAPGGGWNPEEFLKRLDRNGDGKLEGPEIEGRTERFLSQMGFDTSKPVLLSAVAEKVSGGRSATSTAAKEPERRVPGFGATTEKVPGFSSSTSEEDISSFGESIIRQVDWVLDNYDRNKNGMIDEIEMSEIPAGSPPLAESDTNRDGKISKLELANRYRAREQFSRRNEGNNRDRDRNDASERSEGRESGMGRGRFSAEPSGRSSSRSSSRSSARSSSGSSSSSSPSGPAPDPLEKTKAYVENIIKRYDSDNDGKLSAEEIKASEMRNPPKPDADGFVTKEAYVNFLIAPSGATPAAAADSEGSSDASSSRESSRGPSSSSRVSSRRDSADSSRTRATTRRKVTFEDYDVDGNGMIEMHEFAEEWDDETLEQFYKKDINGDGVITAKEWKGY